jgi:clan AA aspartic protease
MDIVVDTGFTGYLTLPPSQIIALQLPFQQRQTYTLGDGTDVQFDVYLATVLWDGRDRDVAVLATEGAALTGMRMLRGYRLLIDVIDGGEVLIEARP